MLSELIVTDLGVIDRLGLVFGPGMTAVTGETGAGKTLIVEAIDLLVGGRADASMVRAGATEAIVEGRFVLDDDEVILRRVVPREGRSRAYINGSPATIAALAEAGSRFVDLHGQHDHQSLLRPSVQRGALDRFGGIDVEPLQEARRALAEIDRRLAAMGGDERERAREIDLLTFQVRELDAAHLDRDDEDEVLEAEEDALGDALAHEEAAAAAGAALSSDGGAAGLAAIALAALDGRGPFTEVTARLQSLVAELADVARDVRSLGESIEDDPERLDQVRERRRLLHELKRKYGETVAEVRTYREQVGERLRELESRDATAAALDAERTKQLDVIAKRERALGKRRRAAAPELAAATEANLRELAMAAARLDVEVGEDPGDDVQFRIAANPGSDPLPLAKVASGGELARAMLALRLVLTEAPDTLVFDEVDAGIGGATATAVGRALAALAARHQVLVVTHLPQVAAYADAQVQVTKHTKRSRTSTSAAVLDVDDRVVELARMLSGSPDSDTARGHAKEMLADADQDRSKARRRGGLLTG
jgi:DNA repair protein RecN (Recombination protein N)